MEISITTRRQQFAGRLLAIYEYSKEYKSVPNKLLEELTYDSCLNAAKKVLLELCRPGHIEKKERTEIERIVNILSDTYIGFGVKDVVNLEEWNNEVGLNAYNKEKALINCSLVLRQAIAKDPNRSVSEYEKLFDWRWWDIVGFSTFNNKMNYLFIQAITNCAMIKEVVRLEDIKSEMDMLLYIDTNCKNCWEHRNRPKSIR